MQDALLVAEGKLQQAQENYACEEVRRWALNKYPKRMRFKPEEEAAFRQEMADVFDKKYAEKIGEPAWLLVKDSIVFALKNSVWGSPRIKNPSLKVLQKEVTRYETALQQLRQSYLSPFFSEKQRAHLKTLLERLQTLKDSDELSGDGKLHTQMRALVEALEAHMNDFLQNKLNYPDFKARIKETIEDDSVAVLKKPNGRFHRLYNAVVAVFRAFFRLFDLAWVVGRPTMAATYTPLAQTLVGRKHFFEYAEESVSSELMQLTKDLDDSMQAIDDLMPAQHMSLSS
ncbi:MAG: hypothetical protein P1U32_06150 [Legionellaceae bacterium]|nr:hypothetical protein [Legionellaceae bacterium]